MEIYQNKIMVSQFGVSIFEKKLLQNVYDVQLKFKCTCPILKNLIFKGNETTTVAKTDKNR